LTAALSRALAALLAAGVLATAGLAGAPSAQAAPIRECGNWGYHDSSGYFGWGISSISGAGIYNLTTRLVGCRTARRFARRYQGTDTYYPRWRCRERDDYEASDVRCTASGGRVIHWQSGA
jgi:hypothetical protein